MRSPFVAEPLNDTIGTREVMIEHPHQAALLPWNNVLERFCKDELFQVPV